MVHCLHCGREYESYEISWVEQPGLGPLGEQGMWCCPTQHCDGKGFGNDILPLDASSDTALGHDWLDAAGECDDELGSCEDLASLFDGGNGLCFVDDAGEDDDDFETDDFDSDLDWAELSDDTSDHDDWQAEEVCECTLGMGVDPEDDGLLDLGPLQREGFFADHWVDWGAEMDPGDRFDRRDKLEREDEIQG